MSDPSKLFSQGSDAIQKLGLLGKVVPSLTLSSSIAALGAWMGGVGLMFSLIQFLGRPTKREVAIEVTNKVCAAINDYLAQRFHRAAVERFGSAYTPAQMGIVICDTYEDELVAQLNSKEPYLEPGGQLFALMLCAHVVESDPQLVSGCGYNPFRPVLDEALKRFRAAARTDVSMERGHRTIVLGTPPATSYRYIDTDMARVVPIFDVSNADFGALRQLGPFGLPGLNGFESRRWTSVPHFSFERDKGTLLWPEPGYLHAYNSTLEDNVWAFKDKHPKVSLIRSIDYSRHPSLRLPRHAVVQPSSTATIKDSHYATKSKTNAYQTR